MASWTLLATCTARRIGCLSIWAVEANGEFCVIGERVDGAVLARFLGLLVVVLTRHAWQAIWVTVIVCVHANLTFYALVTTSSGLLPTFWTEYTMYAI